MRNVHDPHAAAKLLVDHALQHFSTDNLSCMIVRFDKEALMESQKSKDNPIGVEGDQTDSAGKPSEAEKIVSTTKQKIADGSTPAVGVSASNSGRGHDPVAVDGDETAFNPTPIEGSVEEEDANALGADSPEVTPGPATPIAATLATSTKETDSKS